MKRIIKIARVELGGMFFSPIAWLVLIVFMIQSSVTFTDQVLKLEAGQQIGNAAKSLTLLLFGGNEGFFTSVQGKLYLYIPLLTMGLLSREYSSGSIKLLLSSPVRSSEIILGKFLAMMIYGLMLIFLLLIIALCAGISIENIDWKYLIGGLAGLYLLICAYSAIGLFMSSLTSYQVVAAVSTLAVFGALKFVGEIGRSVEFVRDITYWVSIEGRVSNFINGLISSKDVLYFLLVILLFLLLSMMKLNEGKTIRSPFVNAARYVTLILTVVLLGYISSLPKATFYYDATRFKTRTLTRESQDIIKQLKGPVTINSYPNILNVFAHVGAPRFRNFEKKQFEEYIRYIPGIRFNYFPYYDSSLNSNDKGKTLLDRAQRAAIAYGYDFESVLSDKEIRKFVDPRPEENRFFRIVEYNGKNTPLRMFNDMVAYPQEPEMSAALKRLIIGPRVAGIVEGNGERSIIKTGDKAYQKILTEIPSRSALINNGFDVKAINPNENEDIPDSLSVLIIADPISEYSETFLAQLKNYIDKGGNLLLNGEPGKQNILNKISAELGVRFAPGQVLQESKDYAPDLIQAKTTDSLIQLSKKGIISMAGAVNLIIDSSADFKMVPVLKTERSASWHISKGFKEDSLSKFDSKKDVKEEFTLMVALTRNINNKVQKIIVSGDADFMSNAELSRQNLQNLNAEFTLKLFKWFSDHEYPIDAQRPAPIDNRILISKTEIGWMKIILQFGLPALLLLAGAFIIIRRKRR